MPKSRVGFWETKFEANKKRDIREHRKLRQLGWRVIVVWECEPNRAPTSALAHLTELLS